MQCGRRRVSGRGRWDNDGGRGGRWRGRGGWDEDDVGVSIGVPMRASRNVWGGRLGREVIVVDKVSRQALVEVFVHARD